VNDRRFPTGSIGSIDDYHDPTLCLAISSKPITHVLQWHEPNNHTVKTTYYHLSIKVSASLPLLTWHVEVVHYRSLEVGL